MTTKQFTYEALIPEPGMWLCNMKERIISDAVYLGVGADRNDWQEIDELEKERLKKLWTTQEEAIPTIEDRVEALEKAAVNRI